MYLYLGGNRLVRQAEVVGVFDLDTATVSRHTRDFLTKAERDGRVETVSYELPKAFVLCAPPRRQTGGRDGKTPADRGVTGCAAKAGGQTAGANRTGRQAQRGGPKKADGRIYISQLSSSTLLRRADVFKSGNAREPDI